ncbi:MAG: hypothetical protein CK529_11215 [Rhodospirillaceae bacterium]|nr:MAG: hypothetical protein CK529_11215 [Rhodospirillaceae bacterium]
MSASPTTSDLYVAWIHDIGRRVPLWTWRHAVYRQRIKVTSAMSLDLTSRQQTTNAGFLVSAKAWRLWLVISAIVLFFPGQVLAHAQLVASQPANNSRTASPKEITLKFNGKAEPIFLRLRDEGAQELLILSKPTIERTTIKWAVEAEMKPGRYSIEYRAVTADSHAVSGNLIFDVE